MGGRGVGRGVDWVLAGVDAGVDVGGDRNATPNFMSLSTRLTGTRHLHIISHLPSLPPCPLTRMMSSFCLISSISFFSRSSNSPRYLVPATSRPMSSVMTCVGCGCLEGGGVNALSLRSEVVARYKGTQ